MERDEFLNLLEDLHAHRIEGFRFAIDGYNHYGNCICHYVYDEFPMLKKRAVAGIKIELAKGESALFHGSVNPNEKLFHFKGEGKKSLSYLCPKIKILEIIQIS